MRLNNSVPARIPMLPARLAGKIHMVSTCHLSLDEIQVFGSALIALDIALHSDDSLPRSLPLTMIFTDDDTISFSIISSHTLGLQCNLAIYPLHRWREQNLSCLSMLLAALEELCHHFWAIADEKLVQDKVTELVQLLLPRLRKRDLYKPCL